MLVTEAGGAQALRGGHINTGLGLIEEGVGALRIHFGPRPVP